jgi:hypothetical protein
MKIFHCCGYNGASAELRAIRVVIGGTQGATMEGDRMTMLFAAVHESVVGTNAKCRDVRLYRRYREISGTHTDIVKLMRVTQRDDHRISRFVSEEPQLVMLKARW